jgi:hypothetical protein
MGIQKMAADKSKLFFVKSINLSRSWSSDKTLADFAISTIFNDD